jgi:hypothetical protein
VEKHADKIRVKEKGGGEGGGRSSPTALIRHEMIDFDFWIRIEKKKS